MPGVVLGRSDAYIPADRLPPGGRIIVGDRVSVGAGAKVLFAAGQELVVADGTVLGANAVLRHSTGVDEIWAGIPARRVGIRADSALSNAALASNAQHSNAPHSKA
jgi:serine O-acetyltransferase